MPEQHPDSPDEIDLSPGVPVSPAEPLPTGDRRALWWFLAVVLVVQAVGLFSPGNASVPEPLYVDKVIHATMFGLPVYLLGRLTGRKWLWAGVFVVYAALSEIIQYAFVPGRDGDIFDFTADVVGIAIALLALRWHRTAE
ncbi:MAG: VanZ family protein [Propionibacteriaceae bacterium]|nr:VanZ family protein [Propionibacteriaceae bacterium]